MPRQDDFSSEVKELLAKRVGYRCSNPNCRQLTSGPSTNVAKAVNIGVAAHITAASPGGARYNDELSSEERRSPGNGIWCCQNCAKLVDNDTNRYSVKLLNSWKDLSEEDARFEIDSRIGMSANLNMVYHDCQVEISCRQEYFNSRCLRLLFFLRNIATEPVRDYSVTIHLPDQVARHIRAQNSDDPVEALSLHFSGPQILVETDSPHDNSSWIRVHYMKRAKASDHPLLPAGPPKPAAELDFCFTGKPNDFIDELMRHPVKVEFWGGRGLKREVTMYLKPENGKVSYVEATSPFPLPTNEDNIALEA